MSATNVAEQSPADVDDLSGATDVNGLSSATNVADLSSATDVADLSATDIADLSETDITDFRTVAGVAVVKVLQFQWPYQWCCSLNCPLKAESNLQELT